jgi:hypothetical protein
MGEHSLRADQIDVFASKIIRQTAHCHKQKEQIGKPRKRIRNVDTMYLNARAPKAGRGNDRYWNPGLAASCRQIAIFRANHDPAKPRGVDLFGKVQRAELDATHPGFHLNKGD